MIQDRQFRSIIIFALLLVAVHFYGEILLPLVFALVVSLALLKPSQWLEKKGLPRVLSTTIVLLIPTIITVCVGIFYYTQFNDFLSSLPDLSVKSEEAVQEITEKVDDVIDINLEGAVQNWKKEAGSILQSGGDFLGETLSAFSGFLSFLILIPIYIFFILLSRDYLIKFIENRFAATKKGNMFAFFGQGKESMIGYFRGLGFVILIVGVLNTFGLWAIGIDYALLLGSFSAILIIIPYIGVAIGALIPILVAFVTKDGLSYPIAVAALFAVVQFLEGNIITPKLMAESINLNPLAIILFLVFMAFAGGILGMIVAVPVLALLKTALELSKNHKEWAILLGNGNEDSMIEESNTAD